MLATLQAFTPIVTMVAVFVAGLETPSKRLITAVLLIAVGTAIASYGEVNLNLLGILFMFMSESFEATRLVMTQVLLVGLKFHPSALHPHELSLSQLQNALDAVTHAVEGLMYLAPACSMWLGMGVLLLEWPAMVRADALGLMRAKPFLYLSGALLAVFAARRVTDSQLCQ